MSSARRLYRLGVALGALGLAAALLGLAVAARAIDFSPPSPAAVLAACQRFAPGFSLDALLILSLAAVGLLVQVLAGRSLVRQLRATRRFLAGQAVIGSRVIGGIRVEIADTSRPVAFCVGYLRPRVYLSSGALESLSSPELEAVVVHEGHHRARRDPLRILVARVLGDALFFVPIMRRLGARYAQLAELAADEAAVHRKDARTLASALLAFGETRTPAVVVGIAPERVDHLLGRPAAWELPVSLLMASAMAIVGLGALTLLTATATGAASLTLAALVAQVCMAAMVGLPLTAVVALVLAGRSPFGRTA